MKNFKCNKCDHTANEKGFCPKDGAELVEAKMNDTDSAVEKLLGRIREVVKEETEKTVKDLGLNDGPGKKIFGTGKDLSREERTQLVEKLLSDRDRATYESCEDEKAQKRFLAKARTAYFFKHLIQHQITHDQAHLEVVKALAEGTNADGGFLTPSEFRAQLVEDLKDKGFLRNFVTVIPMNSDSLELPTLLSGVQVSWGSENTTISTTTARFGNLTFAPKRLNTMIYTSRELVADAALNVVQLLVRLINEAIGREEDRVIVNGSGSGQPKGILQETLLGIDNANVDADLPDNIKKLPYRLGAPYRRNARWLINGKSLANVSALKDSQNNYLIGGLESKGVDATTLAGYPVHEQNDVPLDTLVFGDLSFYYLADREQVGVETTTEGAGTFEKHQVAIKVFERIDGKVAQTLAFRTLTNAGID